MATLQIRIDDALKKELISYFPVLDWIRQLPYAFF